MSKLTRIGVLGIYFAIILALASLRFLSVQGSKNAVAHSPLMIFIFLGVTLVLTGVVAGFTYLYYPTKEQERIIQEHEALETNIERRRQLIKDLELKMSEVKKQLNIVNQLHERVKNVTRELHKRIQSYFKQATGAFKLENSVKRTDNIVPICFNHEIAPVQLENLPVVYEPNLED